jgi:Na+/H+ antiporter NhaD/arsenite permease-like protein
MSPDALLAIAWAIFIASYLAFALGRFPGTKIDRPAMAVIGAALMFGFRILSPAQGMRSIDFQTIVLLFSMMLVVAGLHVAGFFEWITHLVAARIRPRYLLPGVIFTSGILSAFLVNDVVCLFMAPLIPQVCRRMGKRAEPYLLALATSSNIGSTATITGNPQNILIGSVSGIGYRDFLVHLGPVAVIGLCLDWVVLHWLYPDRSQTQPVVPTAGVYQPQHGRRLWVSLVITLGVLAAFLAGVPPALAAALGGACVLVRRSLPTEKIYKEVDWSLLVFFVGLFLIIGGAQQSGIAGEMLDNASQLPLGNPWIFSGVVAVFSNLVSNVPAVMLLKQMAARFADPHQFWLLLAMASTLAGNLTITGSIANIIVVEKARQENPISFTRYLRAGVPVTILTLSAGVLWLHFFR